MSASTASADRVMADLQALARIGAEATGGITRLAFTPEERAAHDFLRPRMEAAGLEVTVDAFGNTYGLRPGEDSTLPAIAFGSHVDTVPRGGPLDGALGSIAALEVMRLLEEERRRTRHPMLMVVFAAEEGARFGKPNIGALAATGELTPADLATLRDARGITLEAAVQSVGFQPAELGGARWEPGRIGAFLELHIEQGQVLESEGKGIGLVQVIAGSTRLRVILTGKAVHSGATPMRLRQDALAAAAELVLGVERTARAAGEPAVATVGKLEVEPNSITTIPGRVTLYVDVREVDKRRQQEATECILTLIRQVGEDRPVKVESAILSTTPPWVLPQWIQEVTARACRDLGVAYHAMPSGAGHDAAIVAARVPAGMLFVPSRGGISHAPEEWTDPAEVSTGVRVLWQSVLLLDRDPHLNISEAAR